MVGAHPAGQEGYDLLRGDDLGEQKIAGIPPSRYAALGGFGPAAGPGVTAIDLIRDIPNTPYPVTPGAPRVIGIKDQDPERSKDSGIEPSKRSAERLCRAVRGAQPFRSFALA